MLFSDSLGFLFEFFLYFSSVSISESVSLELDIKFLVFLIGDSADETSDIDNFEWLLEHLLAPFSITSSFSSSSNEILSDTPFSLNKLGIVQ